ncbi:hypothetical protein RRG08_030941 [Elysia crispata]|uniref:Uncharacterized protein n=1 Tax=Elysia crispata TaxID=231223 RepID=A0AAE1AAW2_9GAST|nr:hypothetical protein RRG08_030941 [Elysia crispata]
MEPMTCVSKPHPSGAYVFRTHTQVEPMCFEPTHPSGTYVFRTHTNVEPMCFEPSTKWNLCVSNPTQVEPIFFEPPPKWNLCVSNPPPSGTYKPDIRRSTAVPRAHSHPPPPLMSINENCESGCPGIKIFPGQGE